MFYDVFERLCRDNGYTPSGACIAMGRSKNLAAKWKNTGANPSAQVLNEIATFFDVSVDYLLGKEEPPVAETTDDVRQMIFENQEQKILFDASKGASKEALLAAASLLWKYKGES